MSTAQNINEAIKIVQDTFREVFDNDISEYELSILERAIRNPMSRSFTSVASMTDKIQDITSNLSELNYLMSKLIKYRYRAEIKFKLDYDKQYTILTRIGRPSKQAIESEIFYNYPELRAQHIKIEDYDQIIEYLQTQIDLNQITIRNYESAKYKLQ